MRWFTAFIALVVLNVSANTLTLSSHPNTLAQNIRDSWQECDEQTWCEDKLAYYRGSYFAEAVVSQSELEIELFSEFSTHQLSQLQLNLRSDGFSLLSVDIMGERFDISQQSSQHSVSEVNAALVQFINRYPQTALRKLVWQSSLWSAELISDGEIISLRFMSRD
ncbi:hypothetical protein [Vibrio sp. Hep-1b-8]|uniref:hypothetical protein n=1 Tax=Vibrio sp. Hep-1b-8 TaxID=2144187 RepID=UPI001110E7C5|nr:hypothetical protein [Vibrio sp. Hep-1b-8]TMX47158.1 hypothetical protein DA100_01080 [Vibrio sp. Hep-1b-8]